ncbi:MAG: capsular polysaccharide synthesis protein [Pseudomonadota bacterium]
MNSERGARVNLPIWFLWLQGKDEMPEVVKLCYESWGFHNAGHDLIFLDKSNLYEYVQLDDSILGNKNLTVQALSDVIRINLLDQNGGVWVDATCYCHRPLQSWLEEVMPEGFFAFDRPTPDRMIASWFLASKLGNELVRQYAESVNRYWLEHSNLQSEFILRNESGSVRAKFFQDPNTQKALSNDPQLWFHKAFVNVLRVYPYFYFHYFFERNYARLDSFREIWDSTPRVSADDPHELQYFGLDKPATAEIDQIIRAPKTPVSKLTHKFDLSACLSDSVIRRLQANHLELLSGNLVNN